MRFAALLLVVALAACGGATKPRPPGHDDDTYRRAAYRVLDRFTREKRQFDTEHITLRGVRDTAERQHAALTHLAGGLAKLSPPPRLKRVHDAAVTAFRKEAAIYGRLVSDIATSHSVKEVRTVMWVNGTLLHDIRHEVDTAAERYFKALG